MVAKLKLTCDGCGIEATSTYPGNLTLNTGAINHGTPCPKCGGQLSAPGGKYKVDENGVLQRIGDYEPTVPTALH